MTERDTSFQAIPNLDTSSMRGTQPEAADQITEKTDVAVLTRQEISEDARRTIQASDAGHGNRSREGSDRPEPAMEAYIKRNMHRVR